MRIKLEIIILCLVAANTCFGQERCISSLPETTYMLKNKVDSISLMVLHTPNRRMGITTCFLYPNRLDVKINNFRFPTNRNSALNAKIDDAFIQSHEKKEHIVPDSVFCVLINRLADSLFVSKTKKVYDYCREMDDLCVYSDRDQILVSVYQDGKEDYRCIILGDIYSTDTIKVETLECVYSECFKRFIQNLIYYCNKWRGGSLYQKHLENLRKWSRDDDVKLYLIDSIGGYVQD